MPIPLSPIRRSPIAGTWYPGKPEMLELAVRELLRGAAPAELDGRLLALLCPHAGLRYSGAIAAAGYRLLLDRHRFDAAVLVGPSHYLYFQGASIYAQGAFETPLGRIAVDEELAGRIQSKDRRIRFLVEAHDREHSLEMQLPFLQVVSPGMGIVPIVIGDQRRANVEAVGAALAAALSEESRRVLLIASSDLSHYKDVEAARRMDERIVEVVSALDPEALIALLERDREHACGGGALAAVLLAARALGARSAAILRYGDSGDVTGDKSEVVGYFSGAITA